MKTNISPYQLFAATVLFSFGSSILFFLTPEAKQDAWLALLLYIPIGLLEQLMYTTLFYQYPKDTLVTYMPKIFGKWIGYLLSIVYIIYFTYIAARVLRDFSELLLTVSMPDIPALVIAVTCIIIFAYGAFAGIENISRAAQLIFPLWIVTFIVFFILLYITPDVVKMQNLKPFLEHGILSVIKEGWLLTAFPYGETIIFTMFYSSVNQSGKVRKTALLAIMFIGTMLCLNTIIFIVTLGAKGAAGNLFPLFESLRLIHLGFLDKLDIFFIIIMVVGGFFKVSILIYSAMLGTAQLIKLKDPKYLAIPFGIIIVIWSMLIANNYPEHIVIGLKLIPTSIHFPLQIIVPLVALIVHYLSKLLKDRSHGKKNN